MGGFSWRSNQYRVWPTRHTFRSDKSWPLRSCPPQSPPFQYEVCDLRISYSTQSLYSRCRRLEQASLSLKIGRHMLHIHGTLWRGGLWTFVYFKGSFECGMYRVNPTYDDDRHHRLYPSTQATILVWRCRDRNIVEEFMSKHLAWDLKHLWRSVNRVE
jgi:hypothetical protein